jgi:response regulator of citrate/malate metabolism
MDSPKGLQADTAERIARSIKATERIAARLHASAVEQNVTDSELARQTGYARITLRRHLRGGSASMTIPEMFAVADVLGEYVPTLVKVGA